MLEPSEMWATSLANPLLRDRLRVAIAEGCPELSGHHHARIAEIIERLAESRETDDAFRERLIEKANETIRSTDEEKLDGFARIFGMRRKGT
jgi:hypothetical protein